MIPPLIFPYPLVSDMNIVAVPAIRRIKIMDTRRPVIMNYPAISAIRPDPVDVDIPGKGSPAHPPGRVILPTIWRSVDHIVSAKDLLYNWPIINIYIIIGDVLTVADGSTSFKRLYNHFRAIKIFVSNDLQQCTASTRPFNFNDRHVLYIVAAYRILQYDHMVVALPAMLYPDVVNPSITVQIQVIDVRILGVDTPLEVAE